MNLTTDESRQDYSYLTDKLNEELTKSSDLNRQIREIAREEADKAILPFLCLGAFIAAAAIYGRKGAAYAALILVAGAIAYWWNEQRRRGAKPEEIMPQAEHLVRLQITAETFAAGEPCWEVTDKDGEGYDLNGLQIHVPDSPRWDDAWERIYKAMQEFRGLSPRQRRKLLKDARRAAAPALARAREMAQQEGAVPVFWVHGL